MAPSVSIIVPCRNEAGNIPLILPAIPSFGAPAEVIFVEGHSRDGTLEVLRSLPADVQGMAIRVHEQEGAGKADAVERGFGFATNDILMVLDADMTVHPSCLRQLYDAIASGDADVATGTRFVIPMEENAMPLLNRMANRFFAAFLGLVLGQRFTDTLCGMKALRRSDFPHILEASGAVGERDPFGDFWILVGAARAGCSIKEVPVRYVARRYGSSNIHHVREGWILFTLVLSAIFSPVRKRTGSPLK